MRKLWFLVNLGNGRIESEVCKFMKKNYVWFIYKANKPLGVSPQYLPKLFFLGCLISDDNKLHITFVSETEDGDLISKPMRRTINNKNLLQSILKVSDATLLRFMREMESQEHIIKDKYGDYVISDKMFKNNLVKKNLTNGDCAIKFNAIAFIELYQNVKPQYHKFLSYFLQIIPYINTNNNILCSNIFESGKAFKPLSWEDFCNIIGYNTDNLRRLRKDICSFEFNGKPIIMKTDYKGMKCIKVNPYFMTFNKLTDTEDDSK